MTYDFSPAFEVVELEEFQHVKQTDRGKQHGVNTTKISSILKKKQMELIGQ